MRVVFTVAGVLNIVVAVVFLIVAAAVGREKGPGLLYALLMAGSAGVSAMVMFALVHLLNQAGLTRLAMITAPRQLTDDSIGWPQLDDVADRSLAARIHLKRLLEQSARGLHRQVRAEVARLDEKQRDWLRNVLLPVSEFYPRLWMCLSNNPAQESGQDSAHQSAPATPLDAAFMKRLLDMAMASDEAAMADELDKLSRTQVSALRRQLERDRACPAILAQKIEARLLAPATPLEEDDVAQLAGSVEFARQIRELLELSHAQKFDASWLIVEKLPDVRLGWLELRLRDLGPNHQTLLDQVRRRLRLQTGPS